MNRRQLSLAGKLYSLALVAHTEPIGDSDDETRVRTNAVKRAQSAMRRMGVDPSEVISVDCAIAKACEMRPV